MEGAKVMEDTAVKKQKHYAGGTNRPGHHQVRSWTGTSHLLKQGGRYSEVPADLGDPTMPTDFPPGSRAKIELLRARAALFGKEQLDLHVEGDRQDHGGGDMEELVRKMWLE
jgi:hypothetical protein